MKIESIEQLLSTPKPDLWLGYTPKDVCYNFVVTEVKSAQEFFIYAPPGSYLIAYNQVKP